MELRRPVILLVDDDEDSRFLYGQYLESLSGYDVLEAGDGRQGIDLAAERRPDVIVLDLTLPVVDGWEALREIRRDVRTRAIPVVALTGHSTVKPSMRTEFQAVLVKPCLPEVLARAIEALLPAKSEPYANLPEPPRQEGREMRK